MVNIAIVPEKMLSVPNWIVWKREIREGKETKVPYRANSFGKAESNNSKTWTDFNTALSVSNDFDGIGFQSGIEPEAFILIDLDHCLSDASDFIEPWALEIIEEANSYTEISPSGDGFHVFCGGKLLKPSVKTQKAEIYGCKRYFTFTGNVFQNKKDFRELNEDEINKIYEMIQKTKQNKTETLLNYNNNTTKINDLPEKMFKAINGFKIQALWQGDTSAYSGDHSSADMALCNHLAFWTSRNFIEIDSLFRQSGLMRPKWDKVHFANGYTYGQITIERAINNCSNTIGDKNIKIGEQIDGQPREINCDKIASVSGVMEYLESVKQFYNNGKQAGLSTGWNNINKIFTMVPSLLYVITGYPGSGKTEFILDISNNLAVSHDFTWAIYSPENYPAPFIIQNLTEKNKKMSFFGSNRMNFSDVEESMKFLEEHYKLIGINNESVTLDMILNTAKDLNIDGLIIDPYNELEHTRPTEMSLTEFVGYNLMKLRRYARINNQIVIVSGHPAKPKKNEDGSYLVPELYDISDSAHWRNKPDIGIIIYRNEKTGLTDIHCKKMRFKNHGCLGVESLEFDITKGTFSQQKTEEEKKQEGRGDIW
jgi:hypothetical protein